MRRVVIELFGPWPAQPAQRQVSALPAMHPLPGPTWIVHDDPEASQVRVTLGFATTSQRKATRAARAVIAEMVRDRLDLVRSQLGATYGIEVRYDNTPAGDVFEIDGRVDPARAGEVLRRMMDDLGKLRTGDAAFTADFVRARRAVLAATLADPALPGATARRLESAVASRAPITDGEALAGAVAATTPAEVRQVIAQDLQLARMVGVLSGRSSDTSVAVTGAKIRGARTINGSAQR
jgi:predicted Zn-dependent peptidase